jgi:hypothetical protein
MQLFGFDTEKAFYYENGFYLTSDITRLGKIMAHYELYKRILHLPGDVVECGVFKGASLVRWATFRDVLESPASRHILGFDAFGKFPRPTDQADSQFVEAWEKEAGEGIPKDELERALAHKQLRRVTLIAGDINETVKQYKETHRQLRIALLHLDVDVYEPTRAALEELYELVVPGGLVVFDDYGTVAGASRAVDEFIAGRKLLLEKLPVNHIPAFFTKPAS